MCIQTLSRHPDLKDTKWHHIEITRNYEMSLVIDGIKTDTKYNDDYINFTPPTVPYVIERLKADELEESKRQGKYMKFLSEMVR